MGGESCARHEECDVSLGCRHSSEWPYTTSCQDLLHEGEECYDDYECAFGYTCWFPSQTHARNQTKLCMKAYSLADGSKIGWQATQFYTQQYENYRANGRACQSMLAVQIDDDMAECASYPDNNAAECNAFSYKYN